MNTSLTIGPVDAVVLVIVVIICILCVRMIIGFFKDPKKKK